ncbi:NAD(P)H-binding protein [Ideonella sp. 4Y16]|uniref:NAD(P)H-binding protein n=1 Tax=Ideonella alba TaxID=2824118 RepID=UPI001B36D1AE|nr:NAD(P)H-binding protein [Ideonella alba]MBQ0943209.1 NAD(P)H-binding protein [Ideonella alba]
MGQRIFLLGASGTIGLATAQALRDRGHQVTALVRPRAGVQGRLTPADLARQLPGVDWRAGDVTDADSLARDGFAGQRFDTLVSCLASRHGAPADAWAIEHRAPAQALRLARQAGVARVVLLSAICVQKPRLAFQHAKLALERELIDSGLDHAIVRPTAFFKSLSGQVERVRRGQPFLVFGDGTLTACKPIGNQDLAQYLADCVDDPAGHRGILPIGGPGEAITPRAQGELLFALAGRPPRFRQVPVALLDGVVGLLGTLGRVWPAMAAKAELARIGRYYATESMLVLDAASGRYDAQATPATGRQTLAEHYRQLLAGERSDERGDHAVF